MRAFMQSIAANHLVSLEQTTNTQFIGEQRQIPCKLNSCTIQGLDQAKVAGIKRRGYKTKDMLMIEIFVFSFGVSLFDRSNER